MQIRIEYLFRTILRNLDILPRDGAGSFRVLCVSRRRKDGHDIWHLPIHGLAMMREGDIDNPGQIEVVFQYKKYDFAYLRGGLDGDALVVGIKEYGLRGREPELIWELYTDIPWLGSLVTERVLRGRAYEATLEQCRAHSNLNASDREM